MRFDIEELKKCFEKNDEEKLEVLGYYFLTNTTYVDSKEFDELAISINIVLDYIYDIENRDVQEVFLMMIRNAINNNLYKTSELWSCVNKVERIINDRRLDEWELAESLLILSCTMDAKYVGLMKKYVEHDDCYVKEVVQDYLHDMKV